MKQEIHPNVILSRAIYSGLSALVRLAKLKRHKKVIRYVESIEKIWQEAKKEYEERSKTNPYDFSAIQNAEANMRRLFLKILWLLTKRFSNTEFKRVYRWTEGTVGPLNALLNIAGACLRDMSNEYPFSEPDLYQIRIYLDEIMKVFPKCVADKLPMDNAIEVYWRAGYRGNRKGPRVLLSHPTLPAMDFVDIIRPHLIVLCGECFIHNVPRTESTRYIRLLIRRLRPYLDWFYSEGKVGSPNFEPGAYHELRSIVLEIRTLYSKRVGKHKSVTRNLQDDSTEMTLNSLKAHIARLLKKSSSKSEREELSRIRDYIDQGIIVERDVEKLSEQIESLRLRTGNDWHRVLLSDLHHPFSLKQVVFAGDRMQSSPSPFLIVGELPIAERTGQADIVVFLRREIPGKIIHTPVMILDIKTKTSFDFNLYGQRTRNKKKKDYVPAFYVWKRAMTDDEWNGVLSSGVGKTSQEQLDAYERLLLQEYKEIAPLDTNPPTSLWKGVIAIDSDQTQAKVFDALYELLEDLTLGLIYDIIKPKFHDTYVLMAEDSNRTPPRIALLLSSSEGPAELLNKVAVLDTVVEDDPFRYRVQDDRILTIYVPLVAPTTSGNAAAEISKNWHLLNHIHECRKVSVTSKDVYWIDLAGIFQYESLTKRRFGLDELLVKKDISQSHYKELSHLLSEINFIDLHDGLDLLLSRDSEGLSEISTILKEHFSNDDSKSRIIVVDGWDDFRSLFPSERKQLVRSLEILLLHTLPQSDVEIIWVNSGVPHTQMNQRYQRRCINPLPHDSPRLTQLDEIIYNTPLPPRVFGWRSPRREDVRMVIQDTPTEIQPWIEPIHVPQLRALTRKYQGLSKKSGIVPLGDVYESTSNISAMYNRGINLAAIHASMIPLTHDTVECVKHDSQSLVPTLNRTRKSEYETEQDTSPVLYSLVPLRKRKTIYSSRRVQLCPQYPLPAPPRSDNTYVSADEITRPWRYDTNLAQDRADERKLELSVLIRPPSVQKRASPIDTERARYLEIRRLISACKFLQKREHLSTQLRFCYEKITKLCSRFINKIMDISTFNSVMTGVLDIICEDPERAQLWDHLKSARSKLPDVLNHDNKSVLKLAMDVNPDILLYYGNNLLLAVLGVLEEIFDNANPICAVQLLESVLEWELYQLGFRGDNVLLKSKYDFRAIYTNLLSRAHTIPHLPLDEVTQDIAEYGQLVLVDEGAWLIFQDGMETIGGLVQVSGYLRPSWYECVRDTDLLGVSARKGQSSVNRLPLCVIEVKDNKILWICYRSEEDEEKEWVPFIVEYGKTSGKEVSSLKWIKLSEIPMELVRDVMDHVPEMPSHSFNNSVNAFLESTSVHLVSTVRVTLHVDVDVKAHEYTIAIYEDSRLIETTHLSSTKELLKFLRYPIRMGEGIIMDDGRMLLWDYREDIEYCKFKLKQGGDDVRVSLSFLRPLVHRSRFFPDAYQSPESCEELLQTRRGNPATLKLHAADSKFRGFWVELKDVPAASLLKRLENIELTIFDVALLCEVEEFIDISTETRYPVELDATGLLGLKFSQIGDYPRLADALNCVDESEFDWTQEIWYVDVRFSGNTLIASIVNERTMEPFLSWPIIIKCNPKVSVEDHVSEFEESIRAVAPIEHMSNFDNTMRMVRSGFRERLPRRSVDENEEVNVEEGVYRLEGVEEKTDFGEHQIIAVLESPSGEYERVILFVMPKGMKRIEIEEDVIVESISACLGDIMLEAGVFDTIFERVSEFLDRP